MSSCLTVTLKHMKNKTCVISNHLMDLTLGDKDQWEHICLKPENVFPCKAHSSSSCLPLPFSARPLISHPTLSHEALFKYFNPECPGLQPIYFIWWGALGTVGPVRSIPNECETSEYQLLQLQHLPPDISRLHISPAWNHLFYASLFLDRSQDGRKKNSLYNNSVSTQKSSGQFFFSLCQWSAVSGVCCTSTL